MAVTAAPMAAIAQLVSSASTRQANVPKKENILSEVLNQSGRTFCFSITGVGVLDTKT